MSAPSPRTTVRRVVTPAAARRDRAARIAAAVQSVPGVELYRGPYWMTSEAGVRPEAPGVALASDRVRVAVVIQWERTVDDTARDIRTAVGAVWDGPVDVHVADIAGDNGHVGHGGPRSEETR